MTWRPPILAIPIEPETERLILRRWRESDRDAFAALNSDPAVMEYFLAPLDRADSDAKFDLRQQEFAERGWGAWAVELKATGECIGSVGLSVPRPVFPFPPCVEIGWRLARAHWGRRYASEAARAALRVGFESLQLAEIFSWTAIQNVRSRIVMERIGLVDTHRDFDHPSIPEGHPLRRHCLYRLSRDEWRA
jgi:RimJ/RimL family protein N-acetyltransferase